MGNNLENYEISLNILVPLTVRKFWPVNLINVTLNKRSCGFFFIRKRIYLWAIKIAIAAVQQFYQIKICSKPWHFIICRKVLLLRKGLMLFFPYSSFETNICPFKVVASSITRSNEYVTTSVVHALWRYARHVFPTISTDMVTFVSPSFEDVMTYGAPVLKLWWHPLFLELWMCGEIGCLRIHYLKAFFIISLTIKFVVWRRYV
jgi:hypothetical protein